MLNKLKALLLSVILFSATILPTAATAQDMHSNVIMIDKDSLKKVENKTIPIKSWNKFTDELHITGSTDPALSGMLVEWFKHASDEDTIESIIMLHWDYDASTQDFEKKFKETFGDLPTFEKVHDLQYNVTLNKKQIKELLTWSEVLLIGDNIPSQNYGMVDGTGFEQDSIDMQLYESTFFTGARQARTDFGVTGNLDGNENSYSNRDIVIAVLDTGIDTTHVDLGNGKVIGWFDPVGNSGSPNDKHGHGTAVASIIAGTGKGNSNAAGYAPGAALVGVKVLNEENKLTSTIHLDSGLRWVRDNADRYSIDAVNVSIHTDYTDPNLGYTRTLINELNDMGIPVFVIAGNFGGEKGSVEGRKFFNTINPIAKTTRYIIGSIKDPSAGGWGVSEFSGKGIGSEGPLLVAPGENIQAALAGSGNRYFSRSGTSLSAPAVAGTYALMKSAAIKRGTIPQLVVGDMGPSGFDVFYGNGNLLVYDSVKESGGYSFGSFDDNRDLYKLEFMGQSGYRYTLQMQVTDTSVPLNITMLNSTEYTGDADLVVWEPDQDISQEPKFTENKSQSRENPYGHVSISKPKSGVYTIGVRVMADSYISLDIVGKVRP